MKFWLVGEFFCLIFVFYLFSDINYDVTHKFFYSAVVMLVSGVIVYLLYVVKFMRVQSRKHAKIGSSAFKQYSAKKTLWYEKYSNTTVVFFLWVALSFLISTVDQSMSRDERVVNGLTMLETKLTNVGKSRAALVVVSDSGRTITCRGYYNHIIEKNRKVTVSLIYSTTLLGFEKTNCHLCLVN